MESALSIEHIHQRFSSGMHHIEALKDISLSIAQGEFFILLGPSGSGKSTLLRILSKLDMPSSGTLTYHAPFSPEDISFVFQQFGLLPWLTVAQNISLNLIGKKVPEHEQHARLHAALEEFGLTKFAHAMPHELSGGMKQRVGLARAFVTKPKIIFLDEPFSELDFFTAAELRRELLRLWKETGTTVVMVSHNIAEAIELADRIAVLTSRPGELKEILHNTLPRPRNPRADEFFAMEDKLSALLTQPSQKER